MRRGRAGLASNDVLRKETPDIPLPKYDERPLAGQDGEIEVPDTVMPEEAEVLLVLPKGGDFLTWMEALANTYWEDKWGKGKAGQRKSFVRTGGEVALMLPKAATFGVCYDTMMEVYWTRSDRNVEEEAEPIARIDRMLRARRMWEEKESRDERWEVFEIGELVERYRIYRERELSDLQEDIPWPDDGVDLMAVPQDGTGEPDASFGTDDSFGRERATAETGDISPESDMDYGVTASVTPADDLPLDLDFDAGGSPEVPPETGTGYGITTTLSGPDDFLSDFGVAGMPTDSDPIGGDIYGEHGLGPGLGEFGRDLEIEQEIPDELL